jgi:glycosyltransferase involved in cell wall biosynthesis
LLRRWRPRIVHTHTAKAGTLGRIAAWIAGVSVRVHTFHGHTFHGYFSARTTRIFIAVERALARISHAIIGVSRRVCAELAEVGVGRCRLQAIPLGLELDAFLPARLAPWHGTLRTELGIPVNAPLVGICARLVPIKRHDLLLAVAASLRSCHPDTHYVLAGDGELFDTLHTRTRELEIDDIVHFAGWRDPIAMVLADLDVCVLCSDNEGLPTALIEALSAGVPVIATDVGGVRELVGSAGQVVTPGSAAALARALDAVLADLPSARQRARSVITTIRSTYGTQRQGAQYDRLYRRLLRRIKHQHGPLNPAKHNCGSDPKNPRGSRRSGA